MAIIPNSPGNPGNPGGPRAPGSGGPIGGGGGGIGGGGGGFSRGPRPARREFSQSKDEHRINDRIRVPQVRLIDHLGNQVGVVTTVQAMTMARDAGLDLVEISPNSSPPVCKILDYGKFKYEKKKKDHEAKKKQVVVKVKEIQLRPNTDEHDIEYKFRNVRTFLEEGDKAKITIMFRGREVAYVDHGHRLMKRLMQEMEDIAIVESPAKLEGKKLMMILGPNPLAKKPKSGGKSEKSEKSEPRETQAAAPAAPKSVGPKPNVVKAVAPKSDDQEA